ncbi:MAG: PadR family transcriptional regulator [Streptomycetaceae bacterium]|nr:PadR family transcriptional regulator [Streptomycetaceae bacterium]
MPKRRKVTNLLGLAVLSTVMFEPMHPYEMATVMRERGKDRDMNVKWGSLYTVVQNLEKHGFLEVVQSDRQGGRPERTIYRITEAGRQEMIDWVSELLASTEEEQPRFRAGLSIMGVVGPREATRLLGLRVAALEKQLAAERAQLDALRERMHPFFLMEADYGLTLREADLGWVRELHRQLADETLPGLELWHRFHETGVLPPELAPPDGG